MYDTYKYDSLADLKVALDAGAHPNVRATIDNDHIHIFDPDVDDMSDDYDLYGAHPMEFIERGLDLFGIPAEPI